MKLGTSSPLSHVNAQDWARKHRSLDLEAINFPLNCEDRIAKIESYVNSAREQNLTIAEVGIWRNVLDPDDEKRRTAIRISRRRNFG